MEQLKQQPGTSSSLNELESHKSSVMQFCQKMGFVPKDPKTQLFMERMCQNKLMLKYFQKIMDHAQLPAQADLIRQKALFAFLKNGSFSIDACSRYCVKSIDDFKRLETYSKFICKQKVMEQLRSKPLQNEIASLKIKYKAKEVEYDKFFNHFLSVNELNDSLSSSRDKMKALNDLMQKFNYCCKVLTGEAPGSARYRKDISSDFKDYENDIFTYFGCDVETFINLPKTDIYDKIKILGESTLNSSKILLRRIQKVDFALNHIYDALLEGGGEELPGCVVAEWLMREAETVSEKIKSINEHSQQYRKHTPEQYMEVWKSNENERQSLMLKLKNEFGQFFDCVDNLSKSVDHLQVVVTSSNIDPVLNDGNPILDDINKILYKYGTSISSPDAVTTIKVEINTNEFSSKQIAKFKTLLPLTNFKTDDNGIIDFKNFIDVIDNIQTTVNLILDGYSKIDRAMEESRKAVMRGSFNFHEINGTTMDAFVESLRIAIAEHAILSVMPL